MECPAIQPAAAAPSAGTAATPAAGVGFGEVLARQMPDVDGAPPVGDVPASPAAAVVAPVAGTLGAVAAAPPSSQPAPPPPPELAAGPAPVPMAGPSSAPIVAAAGVPAPGAAAPARSAVSAGAPEGPGSTGLIDGDAPGEPRAPSSTTARAAEGTACPDPKPVPSMRTASAASPVSASVPLAPSPDGEAPETGLATPGEEASEAAPEDMILTASRLPPAMVRESKGDAPVAAPSPDPAPQPGPATLPVSEAVPLPVLASAVLPAAPAGPGDPPDAISGTAARGSRPADAAPASSDAMAAEPAPPGEASADDPPEHPVPGASATTARPAQEAANLAPARAEAAAPGPVDGSKPPPLGEMPRTPSAEAASPVVAPASGGSSPPPTTPPARQVAPIAIALAFAPAGQAGFTLALEPAEMGRVEIRLRREGEGHALHITAERPETLGLLQRDRQELNSSLAQAGLRVDGADLTFSLDAGRGGGEGERRGGGQQPVPRCQSAGTIAAPPPVLRHGLLDLNI